MKKLVLSLFPLLVLCLVVLSGCAVAGSSAVQGFPSACFFDKDCPVVLIKDSPESTVIVKLEVVGENVTVPPELFWNREIVDYDVETGRLEAKSVGETSLTALYRATDGIRKYSLVEVVVQDASFATGIELEERYLFKLAEGQDCSALVEPVVETTGAPYNLDKFFVSSDPSVFRVDQDGRITPTGQGSAELIVSVISHYDAETGSYYYLSASTTIEVEVSPSECALEVVDKNLQPLVKENGNYNLFYGTDIDGDEVYYYLKLSADTSLESLGVNLVGQEDEDRWSVAEDIMPIFAEDCRVRYVPIRISGAGLSSLSVILSDTGHNLTLNLSTNEIILQLWALVSDAEVTVSPAVFEEDRYTLYLPGGGAAEWAAAHSAGKYNYALIAVDILSLNCYNSFSARVANSGILTVNQLNENSFYVKVQALGKVQVSITADDGCGFSRVLEFEVKAIGVQNFSFYSEEKITLTMGEQETVNLAVSNITPNYATDSCRLEIIGGDLTSVSLSADGTLTALTPGSCLVKVSLGECFKVYAVVVRQPGPEVAPVEQTEYWVEVFGSVEIPLKDFQGREISGCEVRWKILTIEGQLSNFIFERLLNTITVYCIAPGIIQFQLELLEYGKLVYTSDTITLRSE